LQTIRALASIKIRTSHVTAFLSWYSQTSLPEDRFALTYMLCLDICSFPFKHVFVVFSAFIFFFLKIKIKIGGEDAEFHISFSDIGCVFA
jgi:hypothetical protein